MNELHDVLVDEGYHTRRPAPVTEVRRRARRRRQARVGVVAGLPAVALLAAVAFAAGGPTSPSIDPLPKAEEPPASPSVEDAVADPDFTIDLPQAFHKESRTVETYRWGWAVRFGDAPTLSSSKVVLIITYTRDWTPDQMHPPTGAGADTEHDGPSGNPDQRRQSRETPLGPALELTFDSDDTLKKLAIEQNDGSTLNITADGPGAAEIDLTDLAERIRQ